MGVARSVTVVVQKRPKTISRESAEGAVAGECFDVGAVCNGAGSVLWAWLISSDDQLTSSAVFAYEVVEISCCYILQIHT